MRKVGPTGLLRSTSLRQDDRPDSGLVGRTSVRLIPISNRLLAWIRNVGVRVALCRQRVEHPTRYTAGIGRNQRRQARPLPVVPNLDFLEIGDVLLVNDVLEGEGPDVGTHSLRCTLRVKRC